MDRGLTCLTAPCTPEELAVIQGKLAHLLERQIRRYTMEESTSVRVETAQELLTSLLYCLRMSLEGREDWRELLLHGDYPALLQSGLTRVEQETRRVWGDISTSAVTHRR